MNITISGKYDVPDLPSGTRVVVALDPSEIRQSNTDLHRPGHLWLPMEDIEDPRDSFAPSIYNLQRLRAYLKDAEYQGAPHLHVACWMGVSRSTALAAHVMAFLHPYLSDREIGDEIYLMRPQAAPNRLILEMTDAHFGRNLSHQFSSLSAYD